jgi:hypothetical protein
MLNDRDGSPRRLGLGFTGTKKNENNPYTHISDTTGEGVVVNTG